MVAKRNNLEVKACLESAKLKPYFFLKPYFVVIVLKKACVNIKFNWRQNIVHKINISFQ